MEQVKPHYLGKVLPSDDKEEMTKFLDKKYDAFNNVYNLCKDNSEKISDIKNVSEKNSDELKVKISSSKDVLDSIKNNIDSDSSMNGDTITIKCKDNEDDNFDKKKKRKNK